MARTRRANAAFRKAGAKNFLMGRVSAASTACRQVMQDPEFSDEERRLAQLAYRKLTNLLAIHNSKKESTSE